MGIKEGVGVVLKTGVQLAELGFWAGANNFTQNKVKERSNALIRDVEQGVGHQVKKLKILRKE
jgi:hypothetical protein